MSSAVITGIGELVTCDGTGGDQLGIRLDAAVVVEDDMIAWIGGAAAAPAADTALDVGGRAIIPGFVDSHSHLVFAGDRATEFAARMTGRPYDGGGIGVTVAATRAAGDDELRRLLAARIAELRALGTTTIEIKSGYGLTVAHEVRSLQIARQFSNETTFLGGHVVPPEYAARREAYVDLVTGPMLEAAAPHARWIDVFCEPHSPHAFDGDEARHILKAGAAVGRQRNGGTGSKQPGGIRIGRVRTELDAGKQRGNRGVRNRRQRLDIGIIEIGAVIDTGGA